MSYQGQQTTDHFKKLSSILGKKLIKSRIDSPFDFISIASEGIDAQIIMNFKNYFNIPRDEVAEFLNISEPTIYRWIRNKKKLDKSYTIQLFELTDLFLYGEKVFESSDHFFKWLELPNTALGGMEPKDLLDIPEGISKVKDLLGRIEYGVYS